VPSPHDLLPLTHLMYAVLLLLAEKTDHPYELVRRVRERSGGLIDPGTGSFYSVLARAQQQGMIRESSAQADTRRRVYEITPLGRRALAAEAARLASQVKAAHAVLTPGKKRT